MNTVPPAAEGGAPDAGVARQAPPGETRLSLVVPAYNEAANIRPVVEEVLAGIAANPWIGRTELVLVDDGSRDGTLAVMEELRQAYPDIIVASHETNQGFGAALRTGFTKTRGQVVGLVTADGELGIDQVVNLLGELGDNDLILSGRERSVGVDRKLLTWGFDLTARLILGFWVDKNVGIYLVRGEVVRSVEIFSRTGLANLEVILHCRERGLRIAKGGVTHFRPRLSGESKVANLRTVLRTLLEMARLRWRRLRRGNLA